MRKILALVLTALSSTVIASQTDVVTSSNSANGHPSSRDWCLDHALPGGASCAVGWISFYPTQKPFNITLYVKPYMGNSSVHSDPILFECNSKWTYIKAGESANCKVPANGFARWRVATSTKMNGADGVIFYAN